MSQPPAGSFPSLHPPSGQTPEAYDASADQNGAHAPEPVAHSYQGHYPEPYGLPPPNPAFPQYPSTVMSAPTNYDYSHPAPPAAYVYPYPQHAPAYDSTSGYQPGDCLTYHHGHQHAQWYPPAQQGTYPAHHQPYPYTYPPSQAQASHPFYDQAALNNHPSYSGVNSIITQGQGPPTDWHQTQYMQAINQPQAAGYSEGPSLHQTALPGHNLETNHGRGEEIGQEGEHQAKRRRLSNFSDMPPGADAPIGAPTEAETVSERKEPAGTGVVWVWDLDETLIIFQSLLTGKYADLEGLDAKRKAEGLKLGEQWERLILDISDTAMFFEQVEDFDQPSIGHVTEFDDGASIDDFDFAELKLEKPLTDAGRQKLAYLYRHIQAVYAKGASQLLTGEKRAEWQALYGATDRFTGGWLSAGRRLLAECASARYEESDPTGHARPDGERDPPGPAPGKSTIVLVSAGQLIPTLTKCLLFRLDPWIDPTNVYSSKVAGKLQCFERINKRFDKGETNTKFCVVGDGVEEQAAARMMTWPFLRVASGLDPEMRLPKVKIEQMLTLL